MLREYAFGFVDVLTRLEKLRNDADIFAANTYAGGSKVDLLRREELNASLIEMCKECEILMLADTAELSSFMSSGVLLKADKYTYADMLKDLDTLHFSFSSGLRKRAVFGIEDEKKKYFQKDDLFGCKVNTAFPSCITEIRDAGNCYALEQDEASAFHSMRILERGLNALAQKFGVNFSHTNWHNVIEEIEKKIRKMDSNFGADWKEQQKFYSQAATHFMFLKDAWRNHVMHVQDVPYDDGRAISVLMHVQEFMQALAQGGLAEQAIVP